MASRTSRIIRSSYLVLIVTTATFPFQNCGRGFDIDEKSLTSTVNDNSGLETPETPENPDKIPPDIAILSPKANAAVRGTTLALSGSCEAGLNVLITINSMSTQTAVCNGGSFTANINLPSADGDVILNASQTDLGGNKGSNQVIVKKDNTAPMVQISAPAMNAQLVSQALSVSGSCESGLPVNISGTLLSAPAQVNCVNAAYSAAVSAVGVNGSYNLSVSQTDAAGNQGSVSRAVSVNIPAGAPSIRISSPAANSASRAGISISGTCTAGLNVSISGTGVNQASQVTCASGTFSAAITFSNGDGTKNIIVAQTNAQNVMGQDSRSFVLDSTPPAIAILSPAANAQSETSVSVSGSCETGLPITVSGAGVASSAPSSLSCTSAMFQVTVTFSAGTGAKAVTVSQTDAVGNMGSNSRSFQRIAPILDGKVLYANNCATCHGVLESSAKINRTSSQINGAIAAIPQMGAIKLSAEQISAIAAALEVKVTESAYACNSNTSLNDRTIAKNLQRLTKRQYLNTLTDLFARAFSASTSQSMVNTAMANLVLPDDDSTNFSRFDSAVVRQHMKTYFDASDALATTLTTDPNYNTFVTAFINLNKGSCGTINTSSLSTACATSFIANFGLRALRRPLISSGSSPETTLYMNTYTQAGGGRAGISAVVFRFLMAPAFLYKIENSETLVSGGLYKLSSYSIASRLSYLFWNSMPDESLLSQAASADLSVDANFTTVLNYVADSARSADALKELMNEWLKLKEIPQFSANNPSLNYIANGLNLDSSLRSAMISEVEELGNYVYANNLTYKDLFMSDVSFARDSRLMSIYNVSTAAASTVTPTNAIRFPSGERVGLLTRAAMLVGGSELANPVKRGIRVRKAIMCLDIAAPPAGLVGALQPPVADENSTTRQRYDNATGSATCMACHQYINTLGHALGNYNSFGKYQTAEPTFTAAGAFSGKYLSINSSVDLSTSLALGLSASGAAEYSELVASQSSSQKCISEKYLAFTEGRAVDKTKEGCRLNNLYNHLSKAHSLKDFIKSTASDAEFRYRLLAN